MRVRKVMVNATLPAIVAAFMAAPVAAQGSKAENAALCAAFNLASYDHEKDNFSLEDVSDGWLEQADGFSRLALRLGLNETALQAAIKRQRPALKKMFNDYILLGDAKAEQTFNRTSGICDTLIQSEPELSKFK